MLRQLANKSEPVPQQARQDRLPRAIVLHGNGDTSQTLGFPSTGPERQKRVWFNPPRTGICLIDHEGLRFDCLVLGVWEDGARLMVRDAPALDDFVLAFTNGPRPVKRPCRVVCANANILDVAYTGKFPKYTWD